MIVDDDSEKDRQSLRDSVVDAVQQWAHLENTLAYLLNRFIHLFDDLNAIHHEIGQTIYFTPSNTETRMAIVDAVVMSTLRYLQYSADLKECWAKIVTRFGKYKKTRNKIVHGQIARLLKPNAKKFYWRVVVPMGYPSHRSPSTNQVPGISENDLRALTKNIVDLEGSIHLLYQIVHLTVSVPGSFEASHEKLRELKARLNLAPPQGAQIPRAPKAPPRPSRA